MTADSPVSNNGRGLKQPQRRPEQRHELDSPVSNNGRGLKLCFALTLLNLHVIRPLAITGVD